MQGKAPSGKVEADAAAPSVKSEEGAAGEEEKLAAADSGSMDACMELLYGGGAGEAGASSADTAQDGTPVDHLVGPTHWATACRHVHLSVCDRFQRPKALLWQHA